MRFPIYKQLDSMDCGPTCLRMIAKHYGRNYSLDSLRQMSHMTREGISLSGISEAAEKIGFRTLAAAVSFEQLDKEVALPCIIHWNQEHFVVVPPQNYDSSRANDKLLIADPGHGLVKVDKASFLRSWAGKNNGQGIVLMLEPTPMFYQQEDEAAAAGGFRFLFQYLRPYHKYIGQLVLGMLLGSLLALVLPFLTQSLVDYGVNYQNTGFIQLVLVSQLVLFIGSTAVEMIRSWILLHMNSRINMSIISDFLSKLMQLPIRFFDAKMIGDITQRINDHGRIEQFLTTQTLHTLFSFVSLLVFSVVLGIYSLKILFIFLLGSACSVLWILFFLKKRKELDYKRFQQLSNNQNSLYELITGMQEIKLNNCETAKRWEWERIQAKLFKLNISHLGLEQYQQTGNLFFTQLKNILISYIAAKEVINGNMTLGMLLGVSYIIGQMNSPVEQLLTFFRSAQDAKISLERLGEIHNRDNEEPAQTAGSYAPGPLSSPLQAGDIRLDKLSFQYAGPDSPFVLKDVSLTIPEGKVTAIVGSSGSGKTTLLKLLLRFYEPTGGRLLIGNTELQRLSPKWWRNQCGVVMQEGFIFSDTIAGNIAVGDERINERKLQHAVKVANIESFIQQLPLGYNTKTGNTGNGISTGQKQRLLIARAVYKNPRYLFFDEATSALDANNEKIIMENLQQFYHGKTVVVIAHRLSTVKHADQIIVLEQGRIAEVGNHQTLTKLKGRYYELVKNQLELGD
ncbi:peptidase domain-containing ABC transporter [uncultured Chitinophaga sp.]|uniref:peptidase domain-containing ABC transporter n=1 Tax=uncultured Chitinophaga sp. TaxID=339340 RepID=UPI00260DD0C1|nr:peptidase domain-containing ABC transporter [uncultured Chitinophaga sp.]